MQNRILRDMKKFNISEADGKKGVGITGEVIGNPRFDCLDIFSKEYATLHAILCINRRSRFIDK